MQSIQNNQDNQDFEENILSQIKENCCINLNEVTDSSDIASTQTILDKMIQEKYNTSLMYQICDVMPLKSTVGSVYVNKIKKNDNGFEVIKKDVIPVSRQINTRYTLEVIQDMKNQFGVTAVKRLADIFRGISDFEENSTLITFIDANSTIKNDLQLERVADDILLISTRVGLSVLEMNKTSYKSLKSFCILPQKYAAVFLGYFNFRMGDEQKYFFVGTLGQTDYYVSPTTNSTSAGGEFDSGAFTGDYENGAAPVPDAMYIGLKSNTFGFSSLLFAPYQYEMQNVPDPDTGEINTFLYNRYGLITSPLHLPIEGNSMLHKINILPAPTT